MNKKLKSNKKAMIIQFNAYPVDWISFPNRYYSHLEYL